ncbi:DUF2946 family protein [Lutibaculum baratangense]|nr:DUF2946 family protein [Lutibaculum baratangense]
MRTRRRTTLFAVLRMLRPQFAALCAFLVLGTAALPIALAGASPAGEVICSGLADGSDPGRDASADCESCRLCCCILAAQPVLPPVPATFASLAPAPLGYEAAPARAAPDLPPFTSRRQRAPPVS